MHGQLYNDKYRHRHCEHISYAIIIMQHTVTTKDISLTEVSELTCYYYTTVEPLYIQWPPLGEQHDRHAGVDTVFSFKTICI